MNIREDNLIQLSVDLERWINSKIFVPLLHLHCLVEPGNPFKMTNVQLVEGDWKNFTFRMISEADIPEVCEHLRENFYPDEPVSGKIGHSDLKFDEFDMAACKQLSSNMCFAAFDKETGKIAAIRTITRRKKGDDFISVEFVSPEMRSAIRFFTETDNKCNIFETFDIDEYADLRIQCVGRQFRGKGLATEMYTRALAFLKQSGFLVAKSVFTSPYTRKAASNLGFVELARKYFREITDENGALVCPDAGDNEFVAVMALKL
ncbi:unnamed protein product [Allacma fusca]|uniref:N-acetyltransferase domain-containing protein n=1 Tax=Allacma fusca TaxID=39272 RepID=A0A8J2JWC4_9HEXA|nr:unnamed protein product [Allacma fusca]